MTRKNLTLDKQLAQYDPAVPYAGEVWAGAQPVGCEFTAVIERDLAERRARIVATAEEVFESEDIARQFLNAPHLLLDGRTPLDASMTDSGARRVEEIMWRVVYAICV